MTTSTERIVPFPIKTKLVCSGCGAAGEGSCGCGVAYVKAGAKAEAAVKANPEKSDRAIAEEIGVHKNTIARARKATGPQGPVEKRVGKDGKARKVPVQSKPAPIKAPDQKGRLAGVDIKGVDPIVWKEFNDKARQENKSATAKIAELITGAINDTSPPVFELPKSAQEKLDAALRRQQRELEAKFADRMRNLDEEVRQRVVAGSKDHIASLNEMERKAEEQFSTYRRLSGLKEFPLTKAEWDVLVLCAGGNPSQAKKDEASRLLIAKKYPLTGEKK